MSKTGRLSREAFSALPLAERIELIRQLVPLAVMFAEEEMHREAAELVSASGGRGKLHRCGYKQGTIKLLGETHSVRVPRVRSAKGEISLRSYEAFHRGPDKEAAKA